MKPTNTHEAVVQELVSADMAEMMSTVRNTGVSAAFLVLKKIEEENPGERFTIGHNVETCSLAVVRISDKRVMAVLRWCVQIDRNPAEGSHQVIEVQA